jgi:hypothetical protein
LRSCSGEPIWKRPVGSSTSSGPLPLAVEEAVAQQALGVGRRTTGKASCTGAADAGAGAGAALFGLAARACSARSRFCSAR